MPNKSELGRADYVLYDDRQQPLAVIEAKRTCVDVSKGKTAGSIICRSAGKETSQKTGDFPY